MQLAEDDILALLESEREARCVPRFLKDELELIDHYLTDDFAKTHTTAPLSGFVTRILVPSAMH